VVDYCIDAAELVHNGVAMMARVTGMGCTASVLCGAFLLRGARRCARRWARWRLPARWR
jgi:hydroxyethylthiazole kinase-like sugar kinase family protein